MNPITAKLLSVALATMLQEAKDASARFAAEENVTEEWNRLWQIHPIPFHPTLIEFWSRWGLLTIAKSTARSAAMSASSNVVPPLVTGLLVPAPPDPPPAA
jgi:hypothetical protein